MSGTTIESIQKLTTAVNRLVDVLERFEGLPVHADSRYRMGAMSDEVVDEVSMAERLDIPTRTLARYRREGRMPGCWHKNGRRISWHVAQTIDAWNRGIG